MLAAAGPGLERAVGHLRLLRRAALADRVAAGRRRHLAGVRPGRPHRARPARGRRSPWTGGRSGRSRPEWPARSGWSASTRRWRPGRWASSRRSPPSGAWCRSCSGSPAGERPGAVVWTGMAVAVAGAALASGPELTGAVSRRPVLLACVAAVGFGFALFALDRGSRVSLLHTLWGMRLTSVTVFVRRRGRGALGGRRGRTGPAGARPDRPRRRHGQRAVRLRLLARPGQRRERPRLALPGGDPGAGPGCCWASGCAGCSSSG